MAIVVFDGRCPLCRGSVRFMRRWARPGALRFAPALSPPGRELCARHGLDPASRRGSTRAYSERDAASAIAMGAPDGGIPWGAAGAF